MHEFGEKVAVKAVAIREKQLKEAFLEADEVFEIMSIFYNVVQFVNEPDVFACDFKQSNDGIAFKYKQDKLVLAKVDKDIARERFLKFIEKR